MAIISGTDYFEIEVMKELPKYTMYRQHYLNSSAAQPYSISTCLHIYGTYSLVSYKVTSCVLYINDKTEDEKATL